MAQLGQSTVSFRNTVNNLFVHASHKQIAVCHRSLLSMFWLQILFPAIDRYYLLYYLFFHEYEVMTCHNFGLSQCSPEWSLLLHVEAIQTYHHLQAGNAQTPNYFKPPGVNFTFLCLCKGICHIVLWQESGGGGNRTQKMKLANSE